MAEKRFKTFAEFFPFYLGEHAVPLCRHLHFIGTTAHLAFLATAIVTMNPWLALASPLCAYSFAWFAHFVVEKNRPATFTYPLWSLMGDHKMWAMMVTGKLWTQRLEPVR